MAAAVEIASYNNATSNGTSVSITKPTGLAVGELLVSMVVNNTSGTGGTSVDLKAGWTNIQTGGTTDSSLRIQYKIADASDVAAGSFSFTSTTSGVHAGTILRITGNRSTGFIGVSEADTSSGTTISFTGSSTPTVDNCLVLMMISGLKTNNGTGTVGSYTSTPSMTWTELYDTSTETGGDIDNISGFAWANMATAAEITAYGATLSLSKAQVCGAIATFYPNVDATGSNTLVTTTTTSFSNSGTANAIATTALAEADTQSNTQSGRGTTPTQWTNETKPSTTWTNETI